MAASIKRGKRPRHLASNALWGLALCAGLSSVTQASCSRPACELSESGCTVPALELLEPARLSLLKDVALELKIQKLFKSAPTDVRLQQPLSTGKQAELRQRLVCEDLTSCSVLITAADLKTAKFEPGEVQLTALDAPESSAPLASAPVVLRIDHPQLVFAPAIEGGFLLPDVPVGWSNQGLRWAGVAPGLTSGQLAQVLIARAAVDTGSYDVSNLYALRYDAAGQTFAIAPRTNSLIGLSVLYSDAAFFWRLSRVNGPKEEYNVSRIDLRDLNGAETTLRAKLPLASPPTMLAVTADGLQAVISDGTQAGTRVLDLAPGAASSEPYFRFEFGGRVLIWALTANGSEPWISDTSLTTATQLLDASTGPTDSGPYFPDTNLGGSRRLLFYMATSSHGAEPWVSDGTPAGTFRLGDVHAGPNGSYVGTWEAYPHYLACGSKMVWLADDGVHGAEPWVVSLSGTRTPLWSYGPRRFDVDDPVLGTSMALRATRLAPNDLGVVAIGLPAAVALPVAPARFLHLDASTAFLAAGIVPGVDGTWSGGFVLANAPALIGLDAVVQPLFLVPTLPLGLDVGDAFWLNLGF